MERIERASATRRRAAEVVRGSNRIVTSPRQTSRDTLSTPGTDWSAFEIALWQRRQLVDSKLSVVWRICVLLLDFVPVTDARLLCSIVRPGTFINLLLVNRLSPTGAG